MLLLIYKQFVLDVCPTVTVIDVSLTHREESQLTDTHKHTNTHTSVMNKMCDCDCHHLLREETDTQTRFPSCVGFNLVVKAVVKTVD